MSEDFGPNFITLTDEDQEALDAQRLEYVTYYGGEEAYQRQLAIQGISEEAYDHIRETAYLYQRLQDAFCTEGSALYPDGAALAQYAADNNYLTGRVVFVPAGDGAEDEANGYLKRLQEAEDKLVMAKQSLVDFVRHGSELCAQQQEFLNSLPEMQLSAEESPAASPVADIQQDIMHHMDAMETAAAEPEEPAVKDVPAGSAIPNDFKLSLDELKFGRNYTGE